MQNVEKIRSYSSSLPNSPVTAVRLVIARRRSSRTISSENPEAAASVGINVPRTQTIAIALSGFLASLGGLSLSMAYLTLFQNAMTAGRGFIALAAVFLGGRTPWGTLIAAIIFGFADALSNQLGSLAIPPQWVQMIPFATTIIALVAYNLRRQAQARERVRQFQAKHEAEIGASQTAGD